MLRRHPEASVLAVLLGLAGCVSDSNNPIKQAFAAEPHRPGAASVAFRFASGRQAGARLFRLPGLEPVAWQFDAGPEPAMRTVGFATDEDMVYTLSDTRHLLALDLTTGRTRVADSNVVQATMSASGLPFVIHRDGSVAKVERRAVVQRPDTFPSIPAAFWVGAGERLVAIVASDSGRVLETRTPGQPPVRQPLPGGAVDVAPWGDLAVAAADSGVVVLDPAGQQPPRFVALDDGAMLVAMSPSAHEILVGTRGQALVLLDRFGLEQRERLALPGVASALRLDPLGRLLLVRPAAGDSLWIVDLARWTLAGSVPGSWDDELPAVAPDGTILLRRGRRVLAFDVDSLVAVRAVADQGRDHWLPAAWDPRRPQLELAAEARSESRETPGQVVYVQVSSTSNEAWARDLAQNLGRAGMPARIIPPDTPDEPYRVVLGPYPTREAAEAIRARLQMPSWILMRDSTGGRPQ